MSLRRPKKPGSRRHVERTPAQETAFRIFRLRGLYWMAHALTGARQAAFKALIDAEIADLGAETETARHARRLREIDDRHAAYEAERAELEADLTF